MKPSYSASAANVNPELFLSDPSLEALERCGSNVLLRLVRMGVDFEQHRPLLEKAVRDERERRQRAKLRRGSGQPGLFNADELAPGDETKVRLFKSAAGRPPLDPVLMFRIVFQGALTQRSDADMSLALASDSVTRLFTKAPAGTFISRQAIWDYREMFVRSQVCERIVGRHLKELEEDGLLTNKGDLIVDASFVEAPKQRNSREENRLIKEGRGDELWNEQPAKKRQKDIDARWTKKNNEVHFGYKLHALVESIHKFMIFGVTTAASVHDSRALDWILNEEEDKGRNLFADSAYCGKDLEELVRSYNVVPCFCEKGYKNRPLTEEQKENNRQKSSIRCRIEHAFGHIQTVFKGSCVRSIGLMRAAAHNWLIMLGYNLCRQEMLCRQQE